MYLHDCTGAECPYCSPWGIPSAPQITYHPWTVQTAVERRARDAHRTLEFTERLAMIPQRQWRNSCGQPVEQYPKALLPSTTMIILAGTMENQEVLCQQRADNGWWGFPGGSQQIGESITACALRETLEETGLAVEILGATSVDSDPDHYALCSYADGVVQYTNITFKAYVSKTPWDAVKPPVRCCPESLQLAWHSVHRLPEPFLLNHFWRLQVALRNNGNYIPVR